MMTKAKSKKPTINAMNKTKGDLLSQQMLRMMPFLDVDSIAKILSESPEVDIVIEPYRPVEEKVYPSDPVEFMTGVLGYQKWSKLEEICYSVRNNKNTVVASGFGLGKSVVSAAMACWWLVTRDPAVVVTMAPCYDDKTEILTDQGWKLFENLDGTEQVAQLSGDNIEFVYPQGYVKFRYKGEMIGFKTQLVDFLVTPNHRCLFDKKLMSKTYNGKIYEAKDIYGLDGRFRKLANWQGTDTGITEGFAEFLGFWFAEGYAQYNEKSRRYRVVITNTDTKYTEKVIRESGVIKPEWCHKYPKKIIGVAKKQCYNYEIYNKELAFQFVQFGTSSYTKRVPTFIKNATPNIIAAFLRGYKNGDGGTDKNGSSRMYTCNDNLAGDIQELLLKIGIISNVNIADTPNGAKFDKGKFYDVHINTINLWGRRGKYPISHAAGTARNRTNNYNGWCKEQYDGYVYCVNVPSGIVLVRRNGKFIWSGNTFSQVQSILWQYIREVGRKAKLPGEILETPRWKITDARWAVGISPRKSSDADLASVQGRHNPNLLVIMDEAAGLPKALWDTVQGLVVGENNRLLAIGNPIEQSGPFWNACNNKNWNPIIISCFEHPNVIEGREVIPGAVTRKWIEDRCDDWATDVAPHTPDAVHVWWCDRWVKPLPIFQAKVLGQAPEQADDQLIPYGWVERAKTISGMTSDVVVGLDPARGGGDDSALCVRNGLQVVKIMRRKGQDSNKLAAWLQDICREYPVAKIYIDEIGIGAGTVDAARKLGLPVVGVMFSRQSTQNKRFINLRAECWWNVREALRQSKLGLIADPQLEGDLSTPKYTYDMHGRIQIESKIELRSRLGRSPDSGDALALTFAVPWSESEYDLNSLESLAGADNAIGGSKWLVLTKGTQGSRWRR